MAYPLPVALLAGALLPLSMAPFGLWPLGLVSVALFFHLLDTDSGRGLLRGWTYGLGAYGVGVSWVYVSIHEHGGASPLLAGFLVVLFAGGMALFPMVQGWLFGRLRGPDSRINGVWFVIVLVVFEWLLTWFLTGFPWLAVGYGQLESPLSGFAPLGGVHGVGFALAVSAVAAVLLIREGHAARNVIWHPVLLAALLLPWLAGAVLRGVDWVQPGEAHSAALVQGNVAQATKWNPENRLPIIERYRRLSEPHWGADLILWPEAAVTVFEHQAGELLEALSERGLESGTALLLGLPAVEAYPGGDYSFLNTARGLGLGDGRYVKRRLVPFGEYVPLEDLLRGLITFFDLPMSHAVPGPFVQPPLRIGGLTGQMAICYEVVYPELVRADVDVLLTISNDTWFGASIGPEQHLAIARMRALENGRWMLRATNNGLTAIVDHRGRIQGRLPQFEEGVLAGEFRSMSGRTPFNRLGSWPLYGLLAVLAAWLLIARGGLRKSRE
jgi:apolipoprotein N-acyltransferase